MTFLALAVTAAACSTVPDTVTQPPGLVATTTPPAGFGPSPSDPTTATQDVGRTISAIETALRLMGLEPSVSYDEATMRFSVVATGDTPLDNAKLAESIVRIVGDPGESGAVQLEYGQLIVRIRHDPATGRSCNCSPQ